jgi:hypothetical protein
MLGRWRRSVGQSVRPTAWHGSVSQVVRRVEPGPITGLQQGSYPEEYVEDAKQGVDAALHTYKVLLRLYWVLRAVAIVAGISVAAVAATSAPKWSLALLGALAAAAETTIAASNLQERAVVSGLLGDQMGQELREYTLRFGSYATGNRLETLYFRIEKIRSDASSARFRLDRTTDTHNQSHAAKAGPTETES